MTLNHRRCSFLLIFTSAIFFSIVFFALTTLSFAEGTRTWEQSKFDELTKGTSQGIALRSEGGLELAPAFKALATTQSTYLWAIASDSAGNIYAAAGSPARVYRITPSGESSTIFEAQELQVQSLVVDKSGAVYAATAPDGKVYRIAPNAGATKSATKNSAKDSSSNWSSTPYFDPGSKYIWDIVLDNSGNLYVATGDRGEIFKVTAKGEHSLFFKSDEVHIRALAVDPKGNLIAGSDGSGLIYRIAPNGDAFVLYSTPKKEVTAIAIDSGGNIYAAAAGEKHGSGPSPSSISVTPSPTAPPAPGNPPSNAASATPVAPFPAPGAGATGGSEIYRIAPDGAPLRMWSSHDDLVYALAFDRRGRLIAGTGNRGHIFAINGVDNFTDLVQASASQITGFAAAPGGGIYASSSNLGKIFVLGPGPESEGSYQSDVFDARLFSHWGRATLRSAGNIELYARSGNVDNPDRNWSAWTRVDLAGDAALNIPPARFVQWKSVLHAGSSSSGNPSPKIDNVLLYYLPKNVAPEIDDIIVQPGYRYQPIPRIGGDTSNSAQAHYEPSPPIRDRDFIAVRWLAHDDNEDQLVFNVYYRGDNESRWLLLKDNVADRFCSFDSSLLPDGGYTIKVVASDAPSHSPGEALYAERISSRFEVDMTAPVIQNLTASLDQKTLEANTRELKKTAAGENGAQQIHVHFRAVDSYSPIKRAEYSLDGGDWQFVEPVGQLADSKTEDYDFRISVPAPQRVPPPMESAVASDHVIVVRAYDRFDNLATAKTVMRAK